MCIRDRPTATISSQRRRESRGRGSRWFNSSVAHHSPAVSRSASSLVCGPFRQPNGSACYRVLPCDRVIGVHSESISGGEGSVSYTHLRAHETVLDLVCRLLLEKKQK